MSTVYIDFALLHEVLRDILQVKDSSGITMFHGLPGTGKTTYLRYLISEIQDKKIIFIPPGLVNNIGKPDFLAFLMKYSNSILIIEDVENIVLDRQAQSSSSAHAVSTFLSLSDGLLGDDVRPIDPTLQRERRPILEYRFDKLSVENACRLCEKLDIQDNNEDIRVPITLAQIYARKNAAEKNLLTMTMSMA